MTLLEKQMRFAKMVQILLERGHNTGYGITFGEAFRTQEQAEIYAKQGKGILKSKHCERLAIDINLFKDGKYLSDTESHRPLGEFWKQLGGVWGGDFKRPDGNHYEYGDSV